MKDREYNTDIDISSEPPKSKVRESLPYQGIARWKDEEQANYSINELRKAFRERLYGKEEENMNTFDMDIIQKDKELSKDFEAQKTLDDKTSDQGWIQTYSCRKFFPLNPKEEDIYIEDIAHSLSMLCRFTGHVNRFYSVAEHSILTSFFCDAKDAKHALLHDASEFSLSDLSSPLKRSGKFEEYKKYEKVLQSMIYKKFGLSEIEPPSVKNADLLALSTEAVNLFDHLHPEWKLPCNPLPMKIIGMNPADAEKAFMDRFEELFGKS